MRIILRARDNVAKRKKQVFLLSDFIVVVLEKEREKRGEREKERARATSYS